MIEQLSATDLLEVISKQWATAKDIALIGGMSLASAYILRKDILALAKTRNMFVPPSRVLPMSLVVEYLGINIKYLRQVANVKG